MSAVIPLMVLSCAISVIAADSPAVESANRGEAILAGKEPLKGMIRGHQNVLPPETVRCSNCHSYGNRPAAAGSTAPRMTRSLLLEPRQRRGGPPSNYDVQSLCKLLRTGIDPAYILIAREMPTYDLDNAQCGSLWRFLTSQSSSDAKH